METNLQRELVPTHPTTPSWHSVIPKVNAKKQNQDLVVPPDFHIELIVIRCLLTPSKDSLQAPWKAITVTTLDPGRPGEEVVNCSPHKLLT